MKNIKTYEEFFNYIKYYEGTFSTINCSNAKLTNLDGIEQFADLEQLWCHTNQITSLKGIENLTNLILLSCVENNIISIKEIENLVELEELYCYRNFITSLESFKNLINLKTLDCSDNKITSLKPILDLTKLETIHCNRNPIDWVDYIDKKGNKWYIVLPKSIAYLISDKFRSIKEYWEFMDKNQPIAVSRKFNF